MKLRSLFPNTQLEKGTALVIHSRLNYPSPLESGDGSKSLVFGGLGEIQNSWLAKEFFKAYFVGQGNSPAV
jgi:hypothetical protein